MSLKEEDLSNFDDIDKEFVESINVPIVDIKIVKVIHEIRKELECGAEEELKEFNLSIPQIDILAVLLIKGAATSTELSKKLKVSKANLTGMIKRLEQQGLVKRDSCQDDGRIKIIKLTRTGKNKIEKVIPKYIVIMSEALTNVSDQDKESLVLNLNLILHSLRAKFLEKED